MIAQRVRPWGSQEYSADPAPAALCHHYTAYRALVRAKIALLRAARGDPLAGAEAWKLAAMTIDHLQAGRSRWRPGRAASPTPMRRWPGRWPPRRHRGRRQ